MTQSKSSDPLKDEQTARFRALTSDQDEEKSLPSQEDSPRSLLDLLPHAVKPEFPLAEPSREPPAETPQPVVKSDRPSHKWQFGPAFWTVTGILSLIINGILIGVVILLALEIGQLKGKLSIVSELTSLPVDAVSGLYENFEKMERAHIVTEIPFTTEIPVQFDLQINTQTEVVLSQNTPISGARVTLSTGGLEISNAPADIVLPAGTRLPITLILTVPVNKNVPVSMLVPVDIELAKTDLNVPFVGLQDVLEPLYCLLNPQAVASDGILICEKAKTP